MSATTFEVRTAADAVIRTFDDRRAAREYAVAQRETFPGLKVEEVQVVTYRRRVWTDRSHLREVA